METERRKEQKRTAKAKYLATEKGRETRNSYSRKFRQTDTYKAWLLGPGKDYKKQWELSNQDKLAEYSLRSQLKKYGWTIEKWKEMLRIQKNTCALCHEPFDENVKPSIDHDHKCCSGEKTCGKCVRGILHRRCNLAIGLMLDSPTIAAKASDYLQKTRSKYVGIHGESDTNNR